MQPDQTLEALLAVPRMGQPEISPDARWVAWSWLGLGATVDVYAVRTDGSSEPVQLTATDENAYLISWVPDSSGIIIGQDHQGDERIQLFRVNLTQPRKLEALTERSPPYFLHGGQLHPNGHWLVYSMNYDAEAKQEIEASWVYRHDLQTGERLPLARPHQPAYMTDVSLNPDGTSVLYTRQDRGPGGSQVWLVHIDGSHDREILHFGPSSMVSASWFPDGQRVLFLAEAGTHRRLGIWNLADGSTHWLLDDPSRNIEQAEVPRGAEPPVVVVTEISSARIHASLLDVETGRETAIPAVPGNLQPHRPLENGQWLGTYYRSIQPADIVRFRLGESSIDIAAGLTGLWNRTSLRPSDLASAEDFRWTSVDGMAIQGWLYRPPTTARGTIVLVHGGPTAHTEDAFSAQIQYFVSRGFTVLAPNYRGSTGFGLQFQEAVKVDGWGGREQDDIRTGIEALFAAEVAERGKVGITGTSYGGYSSWHAITHWPPDVLAAAAPICGMTDLVVDFETTRPDLRPYSEEMMGGTPDTAPERYRERSPIHFVDRIAGKLLIVQGARDPNVSPENVRAVREALDRSGIDYQTLIFEDEGHGISRPANQRTLYRRLADFFGEAFA